MIIPKKDFLRSRRRAEPDEMPSDAAQCLGLKEPRHLRVVQHESH
jgi:hypothetical protein